MLLVPLSYPLGYSDSTLRIHLSLSIGLNSIPEVFATDELTNGHTTAVKHHIRLQDESSSPSLSPIPNLPNVFWSHVGTATENFVVSD